MGKVITVELVEILTFQNILAGVVVARAKLVGLVRQVQRRVVLAVMAQLG